MHNQKMKASGFSFPPTQGKKNRFIHHFQFTSWPDHGVPESPTPVLEFVRTVREQVEMHHGPMVVHCRHV